MLFIVFFRYLGLDVDPEVENWIRHSTTGWWTSPKEFSTKRNSSEVPEAWRQYLPHSTAIKVNEVCKQALEELGYEQVNNAGEYNEMSHSLIGKFPLPPYLTL